MISTRNVMAVFSVANLTYAANAFACAVDLTAPSHWVCSKQNFDWGTK